MKGAENEDALRGSKLGGLVIDEVASIKNFEYLWDEALRPALTDKEGWGLFISTPKGFNHFYKLYEKEQTDKDYKSFHFTTYDNPHINPVEVDKAKEELSEDAFHQEYLADFRKHTGLVFKDFDRNISVVDEVPLDGFSAYYRAMDFGAVNPTVCLYIKVDNDDNYWIFDEYYQTEKTTDYNAGQILSKYVLPFRNTFGDPSGKQEILDYARWGLHITPANKQVIDTVTGNIKDSKEGDWIKHRIDLIAQRLKINAITKKPRLFISRKCVNLIREMESYRWEEKRQDLNFKDIPVKADDHTCFIAGTIVEGQKIENIGTQMGIKEVFKYTIAGQELTATENHPVCTQRGLVPIDALRYNDIIWKNKSLYMQVSGGVDIRTALSGLKGVTTSVVGRLLKARERDYIDLYGKKPTEKSLKDSIFITLTAIPSIIHWTILNVLTLMNTIGYISQKKSENLLNRISERLSHVLQNGLKQRKDKKEGKKWVTTISISSLIERLKQESATYVDESIRRRVMGGIDSATSTVVLKHYVGHVPVYNLRTKSGMYNANGILVSNCDALGYFACTYKKQLPRRRIQQTNRPNSITGYF